MASHRDGHQSARAHPYDLSRSAAMAAANAAASNELLGPAGRLTHRHWLPYLVFFPWAANAMLAAFVVMAL